MAFNLVRTAGYSLRRISRINNVGGEIDNISAWISSIVLYQTIDKAVRRLFAPEPVFVEAT